MDEREVKEFWNKRVEKNSFLWNQNLIQYKIDYIKKFIFPNAKVLDLGAGDGSVTNELLSITSDITAVEYTSAIQKISPQIKTIQSDIIEFETTEKFDCLLLIGVRNFILDGINLYQKCFSWLKPGGILLVLQQCGREEDVFVSSLVEEEKYTAFYPLWTQEEKLLQNIGFSVKTESPYPERFNLHKNTFFKSFLCRK